MVGIYIYAYPTHETGTYDWTFSQILPAVFASLRNRGWDITEQPLVGIPQAFGGMSEGMLWPVPTAQSVETQTKTYCQKGATGIIYYAWDNSGANSSTQFPWNS